MPAKTGTLKTGKKLTDMASYPYSSIDTNFDAPQLSLDSTLILSFNSTVGKQNLTLTQIYCRFTYI
jgi:hypothetical protein